MSSFLRSSVEPPVPIESARKAPELKLDDDLHVQGNYLNDPTYLWRVAHGAVQALMDADQPMPADLKHELNLDGDTSAAAIARGIQAIQRDHRKPVVLQILALAALPKTTTVAVGSAVGSSR